MFLTVGAVVDSLKVYIPNITVTVARCIASFALVKRTSGRRTATTLKLKVGVS